MQLLETQNQDIACGDDLCQEAYAVEEVDFKSAGVAHRLVSRQHLGTEAPVMTPNGDGFSVYLVFSCCICNKACVLMVMFSKN